MVVVETERPIILSTSGKVQLNPFNSAGFRPIFQRLSLRIKNETRRRCLEFRERIGIERGGQSANRDKSGLMRVARSLDDDVRTKSDAFRDRYAGLGMINREDKRNESKQL